MARLKELKVETRDIEIEDFNLSFIEGGIYNKTYQRIVDLSNFDVPTTWIKNHKDRESTKLILREALEEKVESARLIYSDDQIMLVPKHRPLVQPQLIHDWLSNAIEKQYKIVRPEINVEVSGCEFTFSSRIEKEFRMTALEGDVLDTSVIFQYTPAKELRSGWKLTRLICTNGQTRIEEAYRYKKSSSPEEIRTHIEEEVGNAYIRAITEGGNPAAIMSLRVVTLPWQDFLRRVAERYGFAEIEILIALQNFNRYGNINFDRITEYDIYNALSYSASRVLDMRRRQALQRVCGNILAQSSESDLVSARVPRFIAAVYGEK